MQFVSGLPLQIVRILKGRGDIFDTSGRIASAKGRALNLKPDDAGGTSVEGSLNLTQENEDLKVSVKIIQEPNIQSITMDQNFLWKLFYVYRFIKLRPFVFMLYVFRILSFRLTGFPGEFTLRTDSSPKFP